MNRTPQNKKQYELIEPVKVFFALLIVALFFFAPISPEIDNDPANTLDEFFPTLDPFASSADACPFACVVCTSWDPDSWPKTCATYECDAECEAGDPGGGGGGAQPPVITHVFTCSQNGLNSWCIGALSLDLTASDPQGQTVIISGDINGTAFACPSGQTTCSIPLPEGTGIVNFKVDSATGLSAAGTATYQLDVTTPQISGSTNGSNGAGGWYTTPTSVNASASDALSGIASFEMNVDPSTGSGQGWVTYSDTTFTDGIHTFQFRAYDNAGNITETTQQEIKVDTLAPTLNIATTGATGANGWYVSNVTITPTVSDSGSGLAALEATTDGVTWFIVNGPLSLTDGIHNVQFRAVDNAGNISQTAVQQIKVDTVTPSLSLSINGTPGLNNWYTSNVTVTPNASDNGSSLDKIEASINNGAWIIINSPLSFSDGVHTYQVRVSDQAGNQTTTPLQTVQVDTVAPTLTAPTSLNLLETLPYQLTDPSTGSGQASGLNQFSIIIEEKDNRHPATGLAWALTGTTSNGSYRWNALFGNDAVAEVGWHPMTLKLMDMAGNETVLAGSIEVTWKNLVYLELTGNHDQVNNTPPSNSSGSIAYAGGPVTSNEVTSNELSVLPELTFGGETNQIPANQETTTITAGGVKSTLDRMSLQAGGSTFAAGNQSTSLPTANPNILWGAAAAATLGATLAEWQKKREEEEAARKAALINRGMDEEAGDWEQERNSRKAAQKLAKTNPSKAYAQAQEREVRAAIAEATAKEQKAWERDRTVMVEATDAYKQSEDKGQYLKQEFQAIRAQELDYREEQREKEQAMQAYLQGERDAVAIAQEYDARAHEQAFQKYHAGERDAVSIAVEYEARVHEQAMHAHRAGELNAVEIVEAYKTQVREQTVQAYHEGERDAESIAEQARLNAVYAERWAGVASMALAEAENHWWEKTKTFVNETIIQPTNTYIYQPIIKPAIEQTQANITYLKENVYQPYIEPKLEEIAKSFDEKIYQPIIKPVVDVVSDFVSVKFAEFNEKFYQPVIKPMVEQIIEKTKEMASEVLLAFNENIYQPFILPTAVAAYENFYQPFIQPILQKINDGFIQPIIKPLIEKIADYFENGEKWVNENIYQPIFAPVVNDINKYIYKPISKAAQDAWNQYGEWVHGSLDAAGFIPGMGEVADGLNGFIYLGEGRYIEASVSLIAMIPILGDLGKAGKWTFKAGQEIVEEAVEKVAREATEELVEIVGKEATTGALKEIAEETLQETGEGIVAVVTKDSLGEVAEETVENAAKKATKEKAIGNVIQNTADDVLSESVENIAEKAVQTPAVNILEKAAKDTGEAINSVPTDQVLKGIKEQFIEQALEKVDDKTAVLVRSVVDKVGNDVVSINKAVALIEKYGDNAVKALEAVKPEAAAKVLQTVDENILDDVVQQGADAFAAFSGWSEKELQGHAKDLAARATRDAEVLNDVRTLISKGPIDPKNLTNEQKELIEKIAKNSTFNADGTKIVVGKWTGLDGGFLGIARETGSMHYSPHTDLWGLFDGLENQNEVAWLINQEVIRTGVVERLPFEYTLDGIPADDIFKEKSAVHLIFSGASEMEIKSALRIINIFVLWKEIYELKQAGYKFVFDEISNSFILNLP